MSWGEDSIYGQARKEGGIVDMFVDDIKDKPKKKNNKIKKGMFVKKQLRYCPRCGEKLSTMEPR